MANKQRQIPAPYADRVERVRAKLERARLDAYLVVDRMDQYWLTGFTGEDGYVLITQEHVILLTDGRFDEAADRETPWATKVLRKIRNAEPTIKELKRRKAGRVGFDPGHMSVATFAEHRKLGKGIRFVSVSRVVLDERLKKDEGEVAAIREAIRVAEKAFEQLQGWVRPGMTERQIAARLEFEMQQLGAQGASFPTIAAVGESGSLPHYEPGSVPLSRDRGLLLDWGARVGWYVSDLTRMYWPGSIPRELGKVYEVVREAHDRAIEAIRPGVKASFVDKVARDFISKAGYGERFNHSLGHGIGLDVHESPRVGRKVDTLLQAGMVITIEPGIYLPGVGGVRLEDDVLVTDSGYEVLSSLPI